MNPLPWLLTDHGRRLKCEVAQAGTCNTYLSNTSTIARLGFITNFLTRNGFYVVLQDTESGLAIENPDAWLSNWATLLPQINATSGVVVDPITAPGIPYESAGG